MNRDIEQILEEIELYTSLDQVHIDLIRKILTQNEIKEQNLYELKDFDTYIKGLLTKPMIKLNEYENALCRVYIDFNTKQNFYKMTALYDVESIAKLVYKESKKLRGVNIDKE